MIVDFRRIQSFIAVAELGGFRKAAAHLSISQPALTSHIKALEERLGVRLLTRTTRQVVLTPDGEAFLTRAQRALGELNSAVDELRQRAAVQRGRVVLGCTPSIAHSLVPRALAVFHRRYPQVEVILFDDSSENLERRLLASEVDMVIGPAPESLRDMDYTHLFDDSFMAIVPAGHELAGKSKVALKELLRHDLVAVRSGLRMRNILQLAIAREGCELKPVREASSQYTLCALVEAGLGVGMLPRLIVSGLGRRSLQAARIISPEISRRIGLMTRRGQLLHPTAQRFVDVLKKETTAQATAREAE